MFIRDETTNGDEIDKLTHKEVVRIGIGAPDLEKLHEIVKLAVYVAADGDRAFLRHIRCCVTADTNWASSLLAVRWIPLAEPLSPVALLAISLPQLNSSS